jgi:hypothetical protein
MERVGSIPLDSVFMVYRKAGFKQVSAIIGTRHLVNRLPLDDLKTDIRPWTGCDE